MTGPEPGAMMSGQLTWLGAPVTDPRRAETAMTLIFGREKTPHPLAIGGGTYQVWVDMADLRAAGEREPGGVRFRSEEYEFYVPVGI